MAEQLAESLSFFLIVDAPATKILQILLFIIVKCLPNLT